MAAVPFAIFGAGGGASGVRKGDVFKTYLASDGGQRHGAGGIGDLRDRVEHFKDALPGRGGDDNRRDDHAQPADGVDQLAQVGAEGDHLTQAELALDHGAPAKPDDQRRAQVGQQEQQRQVEGLQPGGISREVKPALVRLGEARGLGGALGKGFDHLGAAQVLLYDGRQHPHLTLDLHRKRAVAPAKLEGCQQQERHEHQHQQRQAGVHPDQGQAGAQHQQQRFEHAQGGPPGEEADALHILHGARQQVAGLGLVVEREGQDGELALDIIAQVIGHVLRGDLAPAAFQKGQPAAQQGQRQQAQGGPHQHLQILLASTGADAGANTYVDAPAQELRDGDIEGGDTQGADIGRADDLPVRGQVAIAAPQVIQGVFGDLQGGGVEGILHDKWFL